MVKALVIEVEDAFSSPLFEVTFASKTTAPNPAPGSPTGRGVLRWRARDLELDEAALLAHRPKCRPTPTRHCATTHPRTGSSFFDEACRGAARRSGGVCNRS